MATNAPSETFNVLDQLRPGWMPLLDDMVLIRGKPEEDFESMLATIYKEYLLSDDDNASATFARRFDDLYGDVYEPKFNGFNGKKRGWTGYLDVFYETVFSVAVAMDYDEPKQIKIIQLLSELRKLPTRAVKIFVQGEFAWIDSEIWTRDPLFPWALREHDPGSMTVKDAENLNSQKDIDEFEDHFAAYLSYQTFSARCTAAGLDKGDTSRFESPGSYISAWLQSDWELLDCQIVVISQWILIAGDEIHAECVRKQLPRPARRPAWDGWYDGNGPIIWKQWGDKLAEFAAGLEGGGNPGFRLFENHREVLTGMVVKARDKMIALEPGLFTK
ncbi:hypothetical protein F5144DRAFT_489466 [Chaetomium tenue]|uniref:Uncharacterized protein n=1 Tax=Chaetomium tenue TaxID=1854479 RepID=A0ACB7P778_9PEZI|nr:hypothetical protein F5144DRAFT_489466 [Chaetomium globosum]